jgi:GT2 family glycosyltransferase
MYDVDFSFRAWRAGCCVAVCNDLDVVHGSRGTHDASYGEALELFERKHCSALQPLVTR